MGALVSLGFFCFVSSVLITLIVKGYVVTAVVLFVMIILSIKIKLRD